MVRHFDTDALSKERLIEIQSVSQLGAWDWHIDTDELFWSSEVFSIFGITEEQFGENYSSFLELVHPDDVDEVKEAVNECRQDGTPYRLEHRVKRPDGTIRFVLERGRLVQHEDGPHMIGTVMDVSDVKWAVMASKRRMQREKSINKITGLLLENNDLGVIMRKALEIIFQLKWLDIHHRGTIFTADPENRRLDMVAQIGLDTSPVLPNCRSIEYGYCFCGRVAAGEEDLFVASESHPHNGHDFHFEEMTDHGHIILKIKKEETLLGILNLYTGPHESIDQQDLDFLQSVANTLAGIIEIKRMEKELRQEAIHFKNKSLLDALTGLPNRAHLDETIIQVHADAVTRETPYSILYIDLNDFKTVNDTIGHDAGDHILVTFAAIMKATFRQDDLCCRIGGDEFVVLLPGAKKKSAV
ncbi:MAG: diguanylate cyclase, partial [Magnetococcales bacterium]|nr:diguanylate cyclase [Magnetococcales bacterium]